MLSEKCAMWLKVLRKIEQLAKKLVIRLDLITSCRKDLVKEFKEEIVYRDNIHRLMNN
jgi:hypothetical protein